MKKVSIFNHAASAISEPTSRIRGSAVKLSIIIVNYRTVKLTLQCIKSIYKFAPTYLFEIIVLDNGSDDLIAAKIGEGFPEVHFIELGKNAGFTEANNLGINNSHGELVVLLNSDTKLVEPVFDHLIKEMDADPAIGAIGPKHLDGDKKFQFSSGKFPTFATEIIRKLIHYRLAINSVYVRDYFDEKYSAQTSVDWLSGSCLLVRRKALHEIGLLDERFFMYFEDIDLCYRLKRKGWKVQFCAKTKIVHFGGQSVRRDLLRALVEYRHSQSYFARKYYGVLGGCLFRIFLLIKYGFHFLKWTPIFVFNVLVRSRNRKHSYTMLLLAKKVVAGAFRPTPSSHLEMPLISVASA